MAIGTNSLRGIVHEEFHYPFLVSGGTAVNIQDVGKAVTLDTAAANTVKLAVDGDSILGPMVVYEDRTQAEGTVNGTVALRGGYRFLVKPNAGSASPSQAPAIGDYLVGAVDGTKGGYVRKATSVELATGTKSLWQVVQVEGTTSVVAIHV